MSSKVSDQIAQQGVDESLDLAIHPHIGTVLEYHGNVVSCQCKRHKGETLREEERHSVDVEITTGKKKETLYSVPCFVYAEGVISKGFVKDDRVLVLYMNGDKTMPIVAAYYREPSQLDIFWNDFKQRAGKVFLELLPDLWDGDFE